MKLLIVFGEGGHTKELLNLVSMLGENFEYTFLMTHQDQLAAARLPFPGSVYRIIRPRSKQDNPLTAAVKTAIAAIQSLAILVRTRPSAIVSSGPAIAVPVSILGKLLRMRVIYVETGSRVHQISLTGRILYRWADLFFVQWPGLKKTYPKAIYAGRLV